ncbi:MAG: PorP/SprF family type IX secretion system membrane protein [Bacteroidota bacterium]
MRFLLALLFLLPSFVHFGQMKFKFKQYMLHQTIYNPGYADPETKFSVNTLYRRQWLRQENYPEAFFAYGHYNFDRNHSVAGILSNDLINKYNQFEVAASYVYNIPIGYDYNLGLGIKAGFIEQNLLNTNLTYFDPNEPVLADGNYTTHFLNLGTGISFTSRDLSLHFGIPQLFGNRFINQQMIYNTKNMHMFMNAGYKFHKTDWFIIYPNIMMYAVRGSKFHGSMHVNFLASQLVWGGFGIDSDLTINGCVGLFTQSGFRIVYSIDNRFFPKNQTTGVSHELSVSYAKTIKNNPFSRRKYKGGRRRR